MDSRYFDDLVQHFGTPLERRSALASLMAAFLSLLIRDGGGAKRKGRKDGNKRQPHRNRKPALQEEARRHRKGRKHKRHADNSGGEPPLSPDPSQDPPTRCFDNTTCEVGNGRNLDSCNFGASAALRGAACNGCNLDNANLRGADLRQANLSGANLHDTCLVEANLTGAITEGASLDRAILCRTIMPDGSINNSGCHRPTTCCPTCISQGNACRDGLDGDCCGGAACVDGTCACVAPRSILCAGVCEECCTGGDCPSGVCCDHVCCQDGARCQDETCCLPLTAAEACTDKCGTLDAGCGVTVECPACPADICHDSRCANNTCEYSPQPNLTACEAGASAGVCCDAACLTGNCCGSGDCANPTPICREHVCAPCGGHTECPGGQLCCDGSCRAVECCGSDTSTCGDAETCYAGSCDGGACVYTAEPDNQPGNSCNAGGEFCCAGNCCSAGQRCYQGACCNPAIACPATFCGTVSDGCGGQARCTCPSGTTCCASDCVDVQNDENNCGGCGVRCDAGEVCVNSVCESTCGQEICLAGSSTPDCCVDQCTNLQEDNANCGTCNQACTGQGRRCVQGECRCGCAGVACLVTRWGGSGSQPGQFQRPIAFALAPDGRQFVVDSTAGEIKIFSASGSHQATWTGFELPGGIAFGADDSVYISESGRNVVGRYTMSGVLIAEWGNTGATANQLRVPNGVTVGPDGDVYVADKTNNRVQRYTADGTRVRTYGSGTSLQAPSDVAVAPDGRVFVTNDRADMIRIFSAAGSLLTSWGSTGSQLGQFREPFEIAISAAGLVYILEDGNSRAQIFDLNGRPLAQWNTTEAGQPDLVLSDGGGLDIGPDGTVYIVEGATGRVLVYCMTPPV